MAKKKKNTGEDNPELITKCDHINIDIRSMIRVIRGFPDDFMFQLTKEELESLRSHIVTSNLTTKDNNGIWTSQNAISKSVESQQDKV